MTARTVGTRVWTTQGPGIGGVIVAWAQVPRSPSRDFFGHDISDTRPGFAIVLLETGDVALCATGHWKDVYARNCVASGVDPVDAFANLMLKTTLIESMHRVACWDKFEIGAQLAAMWKRQKKAKEEAGNA